MLIILGGLPGTGKTTISKEIAKKLKAVYLRIDTVEQAIKRIIPQTQHLNDSEGYSLSYAIAKDNLQLGLTVVADSVNPLSITRSAWRGIAREANTDFIEIELVCSNKEEHKQRIETRTSDIIGLKLPTWEDVLSREYETWDTNQFIIDTSRNTIEETLQLILNGIQQGKQRDD